jgi:hypothetical protein
MQSGPNFEHLDYTWDSSSPLRVLPVVADLNTPYARRNCRTITWSSHQQTLMDLAGHFTNEQVKIEKYWGDLQPNLRKLCRTSPAGGTRWARLNDLGSMQVCSGQLCRSALPRGRSLPQSRLRSEGNVRLQAVEPVATSNPKLGASGKLSDEQFQKDMEQKLCHDCHKPDHQAKQCSLNKKGKVAAASGARPDDEMSEGDF